MLARLMDRLSLRRKFLILGLLGVLLVSPPIYLYLHDTNAAIDRAALEVQGMESGRTALLLLQQVQKHRGLSMVFLTSNQFAEQRQLKQQEVDRTMATLEAQLRNAGPDSQRRFSQLQSDWKRLENGVTSRSMSLPQVYALHTALSYALLKVIEDIVDAHGLSLDPDADTYYLMRAVFFDIPAVAESLGQLRATGIGVLATKKADSVSISVMNGLIAKAEFFNETLESTLRKVTVNNGALRAALETPIGDAAKATRDAINRVNQKVVAVQNLDYSTTEYYGFFTQSIDTQFRLGDLAQIQLQALLEKRIAAQQNERNTLAGLVMLITVFSAVIALLLIRAILRQLGGEPAAAVLIARRIAAGDLSSQIQLKAGDDNSLMASMHHMCARLQLVATRADAIGQGDFSQDVPLLSDQDRLGSAVNNMSALLRSARSEDQRRNWLKDGNSQLSMALTGDYSKQQLADLSIGILGRYLGAGRGVLYLYQPEESVLDLLGSYMYTVRSHVGSRFKLGEGAVGQVAQERKAIILTTIATDAAPITTGTTSAAPLFTYTYPLLREDDLLGVVELASYERFDETQLDFLNGATEVIASFLYIALQRESVRKLLTATENAEKEARAHSLHMQAVNAQMEEQQQQLQQQSEELQQSNAQMEEQQQQLQQQSEELQQSNAQMEEQQQQLEQQNRELRESRKLMDAKAKQLEQASQYKSEFLANMSHELRTPLNSIILLSKMMSNNEQSEGNETVKWAQIIHRSGEDLLQLINDVLDLSKVEAGHMDLHCKPVSSAALKADVHDMFEHTARDRGLFFEVEDLLQGEFITDKDKLTQILRNLLSNAFKFTKQGGVIFRLERRVGDVLPICLSVRDSGIGIPEEKQALVFDAFQQADGSTSREFGGTGLGLTISRRLAELLGGALTVRSAPDKGSEFSVLLPDSAPTAGGRAGVFAPTQQRKTDDSQAHDLLHGEDDRESLRAGDPVILLIDDDLVIARTLMVMNRRLGYKTLLAQTGAAGLALARQYRPGGIFLDLGLPDMDGTQVLHELKSSRELAAIPVYIVSARDRDEALLRQGAVGFLQKPVDERQLAQTELALLGAVSKAAVGSDILVVENGSITAADMARIMGSQGGSVIAVAPDTALVDVGSRHSCRLAVIDFGDASVQQSLDIAAALRASNADMALVFYGRRALSDEEDARLRSYSDSVIVRTQQSERRLLENVQRFLLAVPKERTAVSAMPHAIGESKRLSGKRILVVDDDPRNLFVMTAALERHGAKASNVVNGQRALEFLALQPVDLILMDIMMPELDGYQTMAAIRAMPFLKRIPVVAISAKALPVDRDKAIAAGADDYLSKPVDYDVLIATVEKWCEGESL